MLEIHALRHRVQLSELGGIVRDIQSDDYFYLHFIDRIYLNLA